MKFFTLSGFESQLSNSNQLKHNSSLAQIAFAEDQILDIESIAASNIDNNEWSMNNSELLSAFMAIKAEIKASKQSNK